MTTLTKKQNPNEKSFLSQATHAVKDTAHTVVKVTVDTATLAALSVAAVAEARRDDDKKRYERDGQ